MTALPSDYDSDPGRYLASTEWPHDDVHPYVAARLADAGARTVLDVGGGTGKLARLLPGLSMRCLVIDLSATMLALAPRPAVRPTDPACRSPARRSTPWPRSTRCTITAIRACPSRKPVFDAPADVVEVERWDGPLVTLAAADHAAAFLRNHGLSEQAARLAAATLDLPLALTMRGCFVYATKAPG